MISSYTLGNELLQAYKQGKNPTVDFKVYGTFTDRFLPQVIAETSDGDPNHVVVVGAHLDSVPDGPGINDDGSGTATLLAKAEELADGHYKLRNKMLYAGAGSAETVFRSRPCESSPISVRCPASSAYAAISFSSWSGVPSTQSSSSHGATRKTCHPCCVVCSSRRRA